MLSTRAGGLGINLTAADTVVFCESLRRFLGLFPFLLILTHLPPDEHDWNPSNDSQAMDRAHRVGQTRQVTVYRLICKGTVEERMLHLARNKKDVQDIVVGNKSVAEVNSGKEIVSMLLDDEDVSVSGVEIDKQRWDRDTDILCDYSLGFWCARWRIFKSPWHGDRCRKPLDGWWRWGR